MSDLINPKGYTLPDGSERNENCNGCGADNWIGKIVPDRYLFCRGYDLNPACCRHDYMYEIGKTDADKMRADLYFFSNILITLLKVDTQRMQFKADSMMQKLERAYSDRETRAAWDWYWKSVKNDVSDCKVNWFKKWIRFNYAKTYYEAVELGGFGPYWTGKVRTEENDLQKHGLIEQTTFGLSKLSFDAEDQQNVVKNKESELCQKITD